MAKTSIFTPPVFVDNGTVDWTPVVAAFFEIQTVLNEHAAEMNDAVELRALARHNTQSISYALEGAGVTTIIKGGRHGRVRIVNAHVIMGDNIADEAVVTLRGISDPIKFSASEKSGKVRIFTLLRNTLHFVDDIKVDKTGNRRIIITLTLEPDEE